MVAVYVSQDSSGLDVAAIASVFAQANRINGTALYQLVLVGEERDIVLADGLRLRTADCGQLAAQVDVMAFAGKIPAANRGTPLRRWLLSQLRHARRWSVIGGGLLALAELGLAHNRKVSARQGSRAQLARHRLGLRIDEQAIFARDGNLWSCPGGVPVLDMCLAMVEDDCGSRLANEVARHLLVPGRRKGDQAQISPVLRVQSRGGRDRELACLVEWINKHHHVRMDIPAMAARVAMSERNFHRRFKAFTGLSPRQYIIQVQLEHARQLLPETIGRKAAGNRSSFAMPVSRPCRSAPASRPRPGSR